MELMKIVTAEHDNHERIAIEWLISTYSIPINSVFVAKTVKETMATLEKELPEILYLELDMIPIENQSLIRRYVKNFSPSILRKIEGFYSFG
jgi:two-component system, response regulator YesN